MEQVEIPSHTLGNAPGKAYSYLQIFDTLGSRKIYLKEARYLVGGSDDCDVRLIAPGADECKALFVRTGTGYQAKDKNLQNSGGGRPYESYTLKDGDRVIFAPLAQVAYYCTTEPPDEGGGIPARLSPPPPSFPPVEAVSQSRPRTG